MTMRNIAYTNLYNFECESQRIRSGLFRGPFSLLPITVSLCVYVTAGGYYALTLALWFDVEQ